MNFSYYLSKDLKKYWTLCYQIRKQTLLWVIMMSARKVRRVFHRSIAPRKSVDIISIEKKKKKFREFQLRPLWRHQQHLFTDQVGTNLRCEKNTKKEFIRLVLFVVITRDNSVKVTNSIECICRERKYNSTIILFTTLGSALSLAFLLYKL